jgi:uncharacterized membrane protein YebE (DUF533 family)
MALSRIATAAAGLLLSRGGRRFAGRHAGKLALATLAYEAWRTHQAKKTGGAYGQSAPKGGAHPRWSGRRPL